MPTNSGGKTFTVGALSGSTGTATVTFANRYEAVVVKNNSTSTATPPTDFLYVRADGTAPHAPGSAWTNDEYRIAPGETVVVRNGAPIWYQGQGTANPGTTVQISGATATSTTPFTVQGV